MVQQLTASDFTGLDVDTVERLVEALAIYINNFPEGSTDRQAIQDNLDVASAALAEMTTSSAESAPSTPRRTRRRSERSDTPNPATLRRDVQRIMTLVQEWHVSDNEEREILAIVERYATSQRRFDAFLQAMSNRHYWGGLFGERFRPGITALLQELEGRRGRRFRQLLRRSRQAHFRNYQPAHELTFGESFWQDLSEGQIRDQIFAYFQGMGEAGVAMAESIVQLITDPAGFVEGIARLPETIKQFWQNRSEIWRSFMAASPTEQARMIGRIFGEAELFLASYGAGSATTPARTAQAFAPARAVQVTSQGSAALAMTGDVALDLGRLGPAAASLTQMTAHTAQTSSAGQSMREASESAEARSTRGRERSTTRRSSEPESGTGNTRRSNDRSRTEGQGTQPRELSQQQPASEAIWNEINQELELDAIGTTPLESTAAATREAEASGLVGPRNTPGTVDLGVQPHRAASRVREGFSITGRDAQSAHIGPTSFLRRLPRYSRSAAETVLMDPATHRAFDSHWKNWAKAQRRNGRTHCTAGELYDVMIESIDQIPGVPQRTKNALAWRWDIEFFRDLGLSRTTQLKLPYANIRPGATP
ncbi:MAG: hypothetical protein AAGC93_08985 [Cyanobacteria bacterium P01_F01_bin.53]